MDAKQGRPSTYSQEVAEAICEHIAHGQSLVSYCSQDGAPGYTTVMRWLREIEEFRNNYTQAREAQADYFAEGIISIADEEVTMVKRSKHQAGAEDDPEDLVEVVFDPTAVQRNRLRVDARKWYAGRMAPKKYGDKVQVGGAEDLPPIQQVNRVELDFDALLARVNGAAG